MWSCRLKDIDIQKWRGCLFILLITGRMRCPDRAVEYEQTFCSLLIKRGRTQSPTYVNYPLYRDSFGDSSKLITLITSNETNLKICSLERKSNRDGAWNDKGILSWRVLFVFGYLRVFLREVIASASLDAFAESSVAMKQAMAVSRMSHEMVKLFAPWVAWKVLPYSGKIALLFVLHTVALLIIIVANSPASRLVGVVSFQVGNAMAESTFLSLGTFYGDVDVGFEGGVLSPKPHPCHPPPFSPYSVPYAVSYLLKKWLWI